MNKKAYIVPTTSLTVVCFDRIVLLAGSPKISKVQGDAGLEMGDSSDGTPGEADSRQAFSIWEE